MTPNNWPKILTLIAVYGCYYGSKVVAGENNSIQSVLKRTERNYL